MKAPITLALFFIAGLAGTAPAAEQDGRPDAIQMGNGEKNAIIVEGVTRRDGPATFSDVRTVGESVATRRGDATTLTFRQVQVEKDSWLVMHPFIDGKPSATVVSGYTFVASGKNENVALSLDHKAEPGARFIVMLHGDVDGDKVFDFVFVDDTHVEDKAVFEGNTIIAHAIAVP